MTLEEIKDEYANEISPHGWFVMTMRQARITDAQVNEVAKRYAQSQTQELQEQNAELAESNELLASKLKEAKLMLSRIRRSMSVHPDCTAGSEFDDYTTDTQNLEDEIDDLLTKYK